ncbi:Mariner Mos1 transposase [Eumeta japonica]|uniref:Mariner Mos1 transposase n=1 Tax=Eumeta variegata TaxID=151549 RepID=A0A4C1YQN8_EUMVA|nr:Mariner Mos1 transposase [Eumeta japonica]
MARYVGNRPRDEGPPLSPRNDTRHLSPLAGRPKLKYYTCAGRPSAARPPAGENLPRAGGEAAPPAAAAPAITAMQREMCAVLNGSYGLELRDEMQGSKFEEIKKNNWQCRIILPDDNAPWHTSGETTQFLEGQKIELTGHPPYNADLAPNEFYLLPSVKNKLRGQRFSSQEEAVDASKIHVLEIPQSEWKKCYTN